MSEVPFTRTLPYVLRQKLGAAVHGAHNEGVAAGVSVLIGKVVSVPGPDWVQVEIGGANVTMPKLSTYSPIVGEPAFILTDPAFTLALGAVRTTAESSRWVSLTQAEYDAIAPGDPDTLYVIAE